MKWVRSILIAAILMTIIGVPAELAAAENDISVCGPDMRQSSGAEYRICMPGRLKWNGDLVLYAHGYVAFNEPIEIPEDQLSLPDGPSIPEITNGLGYAFATTSYSVNGLAVRQGLADLLDLVDIFTTVFGRPRQIFLVGPSEGGIITALALEQSPNVYDGGISACGPVGDFPAQINYWGDVRVIFDYFFPGLLPGSAISIPQRLIDNWESTFEPRVRNALRNHPNRLRQLMAAANVPSSPDDPEANIEAVVGLMWYSVFATNDGVAKLGGQPFNNRGRWYLGSDNDLKLNLQVARYEADPTAVSQMELYYQTTGNLADPIVMLHTVDPIIPYWQEIVYNFEVNSLGREDLHTNLPILWRYGHCNFAPQHLLIAFGVLVWQTTGTRLANAERVLHTEEQRAEYRHLEREFLTSPDDSVKIYLPYTQTNARD